MIFAAYKFSVKQDLLQMLTQIEAKGVTDIRFARQLLHNHLHAEMVKKEREYRATVPRQQRLEQRARRAQKALTVCSVCGGAAVIERVNVSPATMAGDGLQTAIVCMNTDCRHTEYSEKSAMEIIGGLR